MTLQLIDILPALPEVLVLTMLCVAIVLELFFTKYYRHVTYLAVQVTLIAAFALTYFQCGDIKQLLFSGLFVADDLAVMLKLFIYLSAFLCFFYSRQYVEDHEMPSGDFYILGLFSVLGMMVLVSAESLLTVYLGLELMSLPLYALIALKRHDGTATEASLKYFIMGAVASAMMLYGMSMIYGAAGSLSLPAIFNAGAHLSTQEPMLTSFAVMFLVLGICFKLAVVPFHMWAPDVYHGAPTGVTIFLSSAPKLAALGMAFRLLVDGFGFYAEHWQVLLQLVAVLSIILGNVFAIAQNNLKRLFAYSAISHMGYVLLGFLAGTPAGYAASLFYMLMYSLMSVGSFALLLCLSHKGVDVSEISDLKGLNQRSPWLAFMMLLILLSMAGVPPLVGFFAKLLVIKALIDNAIYGVAIIAMVFAVVGAFYYLRIIKTMYFENLEGGIGNHSLVVDRSMQWVFSVNALALFAFGLMPNALVTLCLQAFAS